MENTENPQSTPEFQPDAETLADADSLHRKESTPTDFSHPLETKSGAIAGAIAAAGIGTIVAGPIGTAIGAVFGLAAGAAGGRVAGEMFDPRGEKEYWRTHHGEQGITDPALPYSAYEAAYRAGYSCHTPSAEFEHFETDVRNFYEKNGGDHGLDWEKARPAAKAAWDRMNVIFPIEKYNRV